MNVLVLKTNINNEARLNFVRYKFSTMPQIKFWSVDHEDSDKVLRVEVDGNLTESELITLLNGVNVHCEELL